MKFRFAWIIAASSAGLVAGTIGGHAVSSAGLQNGTPNCIHNFSGTERPVGPNGATGSSFISMEIAHISKDVGKSIDGDRCVELADVGTVKGGGVLLHSAKIPFVYTNKKKLIPLVKTSMKVKYGFFFIADAKAETSSDVSGSISISKDSVGFGAGVSRSYELLVNQRKGKSGTVNRQSRDEDCVISKSQEGKYWYVYCRIRLPYDETTYRWPNGRSVGGLQSMALNSSMEIRYAGQNYRTSGEAIATHAACSNWPTWPDDAADDCDGP